MHVLLLNPPFHPKYSRSQRSPAVIKSGVMYYPIWLAYATGVLEQDGFEVKLIDAPASSTGLPAVLALTEAFQPRLVVIDTSTPSIHNDIDVAQAIKRRCPNTFILLVGPHVSALPEASLQLSASVDAIARGEYDYTVREAARVIDRGGHWEDILGMSYRDKAGTIMHNPPRPYLQDLDALPFVSQVYRRHLRVEDYFYSITRYPEVALLAGRGCPYQCAYCAWPQTLTGHQYRRRSAANVAAEFEYIAQELPQVKEVFIEDDTLTVNAKYAGELAQALIERGNTLPFSANSRADASAEALGQLKRAGLRLLCVGFESGDQDVLNSIHKNITVAQFHTFRQAARQAQVLVHGCFMAGNPGETRASLDKTLRLALALEPDTAQFFPIMVYPGTEAYAWAQRQHYLLTEDFREWLTPEGWHRSLVNQPALSAEALAAWCGQARRAFYLRPRYLASKIWEVVRHPGEARRIFRAARRFARHLWPA